MLKACKANGSIRDHGRKQCLDTIRGALRASQNNPLPVLPDRPRTLPNRPRTPDAHAAVCLQCNNNLGNTASR